MRSDAMWKILGYIAIAIAILGALPEIGSLTRRRRPPSASEQAASGWIVWSELNESLILFAVGLVLIFASGSLWARWPAKVCVLAAIVATVTLRLRSYLSRRRKIDR